jgi:hypothetical protein
LARGPLEAFAASHRLECNGRDTARPGKPPHLRPAGADAPLIDDVSRTGGVVDHHLSGRRPLGRSAGPTTTESPSMIRQTGFTATEADAEERSMRFVEYVLAFVAILAAGILAFIR